MQSLAIFLLATSFVGIFAAPAANLVTSVPGFPGDLPFPAYAGYLPANDGGKMMFYFFSQSQNSPADDPIVLWLNGGPGCSSFDGFVYEHGPFTFNNGPMGLQQNLTLNPYSWTKVANMIYLDSPCGVGLSYSNNSDFINTDDTITAHDSHNFLLNFFAAYPEFQGNDFYIAGESYAGIYVPTLAQQVMLGNQNGKGTKINMKGYLVGNGVTSEVYDGNSFLPFIYGHSLISNGQYQSVVEACGGVDIWNATGNCFDTLYNVSMNVAALNIYNIYADCYNPNQTTTTEASDEDYHVFNLWDRVTKRMRDETSGYTPAEGGQVPCINSDRAAAWINTEEVRTALHALSVEEQPWYICVDLNYTSVYSTVVPIHQQLIEAGYRALVYSGDIDMCVPNVGSEAWTDSLGLVVEDEWRPWFVNYQVAGYVRAYKGLTYATIKDAGHTVPEYKPEQALYFFTQFLNGESF